MIKDHCQLDSNQKNTHLDPMQILYLVQGIEM